MLKTSKVINFGRKLSSNKNLEKKNNKSGRNSSGKIVVRFKSKNRMKKYLIQDFFNNTKTLEFLIYNRVSYSSKSLMSSYILKKDIIYPVGILIKNFGYQLLKKKINNFIHFFKRLYFSTELPLKVNFYFFLVYLKNKVEHFYNVCLNKLQVGHTVKKFNHLSRKEEYQTLDLNLIKNFYENNFICNITYNRKRLFVSPLTKGLILNINEKHILTLTPKKRILKLPTKSLGQLFGSPYLRISKSGHKKASKFKYFRSRPRVLGKSMNICDHPNGGYKHSSKLLKNFKSKLINK